jgi:hypothetical protein
VNLQTFRSRVAFAVGATTADSTELTLIDGWINEGVVQFLKDTKVWQKTAVLGVTAGSGDYTLDTDILALTDLWFEPADGVQDVILEPVDSREILRMRRQESAADVGPRYYALQGAHLLMFHPSPQSSSDLLHLIYTPRPSALSATGDAPSTESKGNIPEEFHPTIEAYAKWKAGQAFEHRPSEYGLNWQAEYERGVAMVRSNLNRKAGVFKAPKRAGRRRLYPVTPGTDIR